METIRGVLIICLIVPMLLHFIFSLLDYFMYLHEKSEERRIKELNLAELKGAKEVLKRNTKYLNIDGSINHIACKRKLEEAKSLNYKHKQLKRKEPEYIEFEIIH